MKLHNDVTRRRFLLTAAGVSAAALLGPIAGCGGGGSGGGHNRASTVGHDIRIKTGEDHRRVGCLSLHSGAQAQGAQQRAEPMSNASFHAKNGWG